MYTLNLSCESENLPVVNSLDNYVNQTRTIKSNFDSPGVLIGKLDDQCDEIAGTNFSNSFSTRESKGKDISNIQRKYEEYGIQKCGLTRCRSKYEIEPIIPQRYHSISLGQQPHPSNTHRYDMNPNIPPGPHPESEKDFTKKSDDNLDLMKSNFVRNQYDKNSVMMNTMGSFRSSYMSRGQTSKSFSHSSGCFDSNYVTPTFIQANHLTFKKFSPVSRLQSQNINTATANGLIAPTHLARSISAPELGRSRIRVEDLLTRVSIAIHQQISVNPGNYSNSPLKPMFENKRNQTNLYSSNLWCNSHKTPKLEQIYLFFMHFFQQTHSEIESSVVALILVERLLYKYELSLNGENQDQVTFVALVLASKFCDDDCLNNYHFVKKCRFSTLNDLNQMEIIFLTSLHFDIFVSDKLFFDRVFKLRSLKLQRSCSSIVENPHQSALYPTNNPINFRNNPSMRSKQPTENVIHHSRSVSDQNILNIHATQPQRFCQLQSQRYPTMQQNRSSICDFDSFSKMSINSQRSPITINNQTRQPYLIKNNEFIAKSEVINSANTQPILPNHQINTSVPKLDYANSINTSSMTPHGINTATYKFNSLYTSYGGFLCGNISNSDNMMKFPSETMNFNPGNILKPSGQFQHQLVDQSFINQFSSATSQCFGNPISFNRPSTQFMGQSTAVTAVN